MKLFSNMDNKEQEINLIVIVSRRVSSLNIGIQNVWHFKYFLCIKTIISNKKHISLYTQYPHKFQNHSSNLHIFLFFSSLCVTFSSPNFLFSSVFLFLHSQTFSFLCLNLFFSFFFLLFSNSLFLSELMHATLLSYWTWFFFQFEIEFEATFPLI